MPAPPVPSVKVDWNANGNYSGTYDDITADVLGFTWQRGSQDWTSGSTVGGATIRVKNATGKYNPGNAGGVLYGNLLPGRPVHITAVYSGTTYGIFGGYIDRIIPLAGQGAREAEIVCVDAFSRWGRRRAYLDAYLRNVTSVGNCREWVLYALFGGSGLTTPPSEYVDAVPNVGVDTRPAMSLLDDLNRTVGSRHVIVPFDTPAGSMGWIYLCVPRTHRLSDSVDETISNVHAVNGYELSAENVVNAPSATYTEVAASGPRVTVATHPDVPFVIPNGETYTWMVPFDSPVVEMAYEVGNSSTVTVALLDLGTRAHLSVKAEIADTTISYLRILAQATAPAVPIEVTSTDSASIAIYGEQSAGGTATAFMRTRTMAKGLTDWLLWKYKGHRERPVVTVTGLFPTILAREVFDIIALTVNDLSIAARRFEITSLSGRCAPGGEWSLDMGLLEMTEQSSLTTWFLIDTSALNGAHKLAY